VIVLDTNVVSELMRQTPAAPVQVWFAGVDRSALATTTLTLAEIHQGIRRMPPGRRRSELERAAQTLLAGFPRQVLPFDVLAAEHYADVMTSRDSAGRPTGVLDAQIAAICLATGSSLATRNTKDFTDLGLDLIDPWQR
jgi:predicted nucleic acid-binding protein